MIGAGGLVPVAGEIGAAKRAGVVEGEPLGDTSGVVHVAAWDLLTNTIR